MVDPKSKVVSLTAARAVTLPPALARLQERVGPLLQVPLQSLFDQVDDALFELADRAGSNAEQNLFFESMRELRIRRRGIEQLLIRHLQDGLADVARPAPVVRESLLDDVAIGELSLVAHDELEEMVAVDAMVARAEKQFAELLQLLTLRLDAASPSRKLGLKDNPLSPGALCKAFIEACRLLQMDIKARLVLFKWFERVVVNGLEGFYAQCNLILEENGVLPGLRNPDLRRQQRSAGVPGPSAPDAEPSEDVEQEQLFQQLSALLQQARGSRAPVSPRPAEVLPQATLLQLLAQLQVRYLQELDTGGGVGRRLDVQPALQQLIQARMPQQSVGIGQVDDDAINLVAMLFQFILEDRNLAEPMKGLIARLQIPTLKVAMLDKSFFAKGGHPARKLLNELAMAGIGWVPGASIERDPLYRKMTATVERVLNEFEHDVGVFADILADFISFMEQERRRARLVEQRTVDAEDGRARSELARSTVQDVLNERVAGLTLPAVVVRLLEEGWSHLLFLVCLREGQDSDEWQRALATMDELLESVRPVTSAAQRRELMQCLPGLLKRLRAGLTRVGFNPYDMNQLFTDLERIHLALLRQADPGVPPVGEVAEPAPGEPVAAQAVTDAPAARPAEDGGEDGGEIAVERILVPPTLDQVLEIPGAATGELPAGAADIDADVNGDIDADIDALDQALAQALDDDDAPMVPDAGHAATVGELPPAAGPEAERVASAAALANVDNLRIGGWVEFPGPDASTLRCRLAAIIRATGKYIFVNRAGVKVAESGREALALDLDAGRVKLLDESRLFDRALESVIGNLRQMRGQPRD